MTKAHIIMLVVAGLLIVGAGVYVAEKPLRQPAPSSHQTAAVSPTPHISPASTGSPAATPDIAASNIPANCTTGDLTLTIGAANGTAGTFYYPLTLTNRGTNTCTLKGYPSVTLVTGAGKQIGSPAAQSGTVPVTAVKLAPGQAATTNIGVPDSGNFTDGQCSGPAAQISVTPPAGTTALYASFTQDYCPGFSVSALAAK